MWTKRAGLRLSNLRYNIGFISQLFSLHFTYSATTLKWQFHIGHNSFWSRFDMLILERYPTEIKSFDKLYNLNFV